MSSLDRTDDCDKEIFLQMHGRRYTSRRRTLTQRIHTVSRADLFDPDGQHLTATDHCEICVRTTMMETPRILHVSHRSRVR